MLPYLVLLRMGFAMPLNVTASAVSSYLAVSPLPFQANLNLGGLFSVALSVALGLATYSTQPLAGILPCGARTFLPILAYPAIAWPTFREELSHASAVPMHLRSFSGLLRRAKPRKILPRVALDRPTPPFCPA